MKRKAKNFFILISLLLFNFLGGYISSLVSGNQKLVYDSLQKPWFAPPAIVFPIVWSILYFLLAVAMFLNYKNGGRNFVVYLLSMILNFSWPYIFFAQKLFGIGFFVIVFLILFAIYLAIRYFKKSKIATLIMSLYLMWLIYAGLLNYFIWMYNEM